MKIILILGVALAFLVSTLTSAYESKAGVPKNDQ